MPCDRYRRQIWATINAASPKTIPNPGQNDTIAQGRAAIPSSEAVCGLCSMNPGYDFLQCLNTHNSPLTNSTHMLARNQPLPNLSAGLTVVRRTFADHSSSPRRLTLITFRGQLRYGWLGKGSPEREPASFVLFVPGKPGLKVVAEDGTPLPPEHLISSVNLRVEVRGTEVGGTFRLLEMRKLESPSLL